MSTVLHAIQTIRLYASEGMSLEKAVALYKRRYPSQCVDVLDAIGSWPSSEPELAALQKAWP
jgi:hypothetical protein